MINANGLMSVAGSLPLEMKTERIDRLIDSLNPPREGIDEFWAREAERRVEELKSGKVKAIPGEEAFFVAGRLNTVFSWSQPRCFSTRSGQRSLS